MSKEIVDRIRHAIEEAEGAKSIKEKQKTKERQAEVARQEAEHEALIAQNEAKLRATRVVDLFERLRDNRVLKLSEGGQWEEHTTERFLWIDWPVVKVRFQDDEPAIIEWSSDRSGISIEFDRYSTYEGTDWEDHTIPVYYHHTRLLKAKITENGELKIGEREMKQRESLEDVARDEILRLKGLYKRVG